MKTLEILNFEDDLWAIIWHEGNQTIHDHITEKELIKQIKKAKKNGWKIKG